MKNNNRLFKSSYPFYLITWVCLLIFSGKSPTLFAQGNAPVSEAIRNEIPGDPMVLIKDQIVKCAELFNAIPRNQRVEVDNVLERDSSVFPGRKGLKNAVVSSLKEGFDKRGRNDVKIQTSASIVNPATIKIRVELRFLKKSNAPIKTESSWSEYLAGKTIDEIADEIQCVEISFDVRDNNSDTLKVITMEITPDKLFYEAQRKVLWKSFIKGFLALNSHKQERVGPAGSSPTNPPPSPPVQTSSTLPKPMDGDPPVRQPAQVLVLSEMKDLEVKFHVSQEAGKNYKERPFLPTRNMRNDLELLLQPNEFYEIELINRSDNDLVAKIFIDGLNAYHFKEKSSDPSMFLIPKHESIRVKGWYRNNKQSWAFAVSDYTPDSPLLADRNSYREFLEVAKDVIDNSPNQFGDYSGTIVVRYTRAYKTPPPVPRGVRTAPGTSIVANYSIRMIYPDNSTWENIPISYRSPNENETVEDVVSTPGSSDEVVPKVDDDKPLVEVPDDRAKQLENIRNEIAVLKSTYSALAGINGAGNRRAEIERLIAEAEEQLRVLSGNNQ